MFLALFFFSIVIVIAVAEVAYNNNNKTNKFSGQKKKEEKVALFRKVFSVVGNSFLSLSSRLYVEFFFSGSCCRTCKSELRCLSFAVSIVRRFLSMLLFLCQFSRGKTQRRGK